MAVLGVARTYCVYVVYILYYTAVILILLFIKATLRGYYKQILTIQQIGSCNIYYTVFYTAALVFLRRNSISMESAAGQP